MDPAKHERWSRLAFVVALLATAIALGGALAHAFELSSKIGMNRADYFTAQRLYDGWNQLALVLAFQFAGITAIVAVHRRDRHVLEYTLVALLGLLGAQAVFWIWTYPANVATSNWTVQPDNWENLRRHWEFSHLAGAIFQLIAMIALILAVLNRRGLN